MTNVTIWDKCYNTLHMSSDFTNVTNIKYVTIFTYVTTEMSHMSETVYNGKSPQFTHASTQ